MYLILTMWYTIKLCEQHSYTKKEFLRYIKFISLNKSSQNSKIITANATNICKYADTIFRFLVNISTWFWLSSIQSIYVNNIHIQKMNSYVTSNLIASIKVYKVVK